MCFCQPRFLVARVGDQVRGKKKEERKVVRDTLNPYFGQVLGCNTHGLALVQNA